MAGGSGHVGLDVLPFHMGLHPGSSSRVYPSRHSLVGIKTRWHTRQDLIILPACERWTTLDIVLIHATLLDRLLEQSDVPARTAVSQIDCASDAGYLWRLPVGKVPVHAKTAVVPVGQDPVVISCGIKGVVLDREIPLKGE